MKRKTRDAIEKLEKSLFKHKELHLTGTDPVFEFRPEKKFRRSCIKADFWRGQYQHFGIKPRIPNEQQVWIQAGGGGQAGAGEGPEWLEGREGETGGRKRRVATWRSHSGAKPGRGNFIPWSERRRGRRWSYCLAITVFEEVEWRVAAEGGGETKGSPPQIVTFIFIVLSKWPSTSTSCLQWVVR